MSSLFIYGGLIYWAVCAALFFGSLLLDCNDENVEKKEKLLAQLPSPRREFASILSGLLMFVSSPLMVPYLATCLVVNHRREVAFWRSIKRTYREKCYEPIHPVNLPKVARQFFDDQAPALLELGFTEIGRFRLKPEPVPSFGHCFQSADGRTLGILGSMLEETYFSFSTLFESGLAFETVSIESTPKLERANDSKNYRVVFCPGISLAGALVHHELEIAALERELGTRALAYEPEQFCDILTYEDRVYHHWLYEQGELDAPPPLANLPVPNGAAEPCAFAALAGSSRPDASNSDRG
jgi:hypothetical protein